MWIHWLPLAAPSLAARAARALASMTLLWAWRELLYIVASWLSRRGASWLGSRGDLPMVLHGWLQQRCCFLPVGPSIVGWLAPLILVSRFWIHVHVVALALSSFLRVVNSRRLSGSSQQILQYIILHISTLSKLQHFQMIGTYGTSFFENYFAKQNVQILVVQNQFVHPSVLYTNGKTQWWNLSKSWIFVSN